MSWRRLIGTTVALTLLLALAAVPAASAAQRTEITVRGSDFGEMIWAPGRQAIYMFEKDGRHKSRCYGQCAKPLYTYAHEGRKQVFFHDVRLNGGYWWVLAPTGEPQP